MTIDEMIAVLQAVKDGKPVQHRYSHYGSWLPTTHALTFYGATHGAQYIEYRVKPEPREFLVALDKYGAPVGVGNSTPGALIRLSNGMQAVQEVMRTIKVREIL